MAKYRFTNNAVNDLTEIWEYTVEIWSEKQAEKYYLFILDACSEIAKTPQKGKEYSEIYPELKGKHASKHIIFYRVLEDKTIEITRILHERMDLANKFTR